MEENRLKWTRKMLKAHDVNRYEEIFGKDLKKDGLIKRAWLAVREIALMKVF